MKNAKQPHYRNETETTRKRKKKKRSTFGIFIQRFVRASFWLCVLIGLGIASYKATIAYYDRAGGPKDEKISGMINEYFGGTAKAEAVSKNLILCQDSNGEIKHIILGIFNTITENLDYITIPDDARFTISNELYQKLCSAGSVAPQIIRLADADTYFSGSDLYGYMVILLEDMLETEIGYYTVISEEQFDRVFSEISMAAGYPVYTIRESFLEETAGISEEDELKALLKEMAEEYKSNLPLKEKYNYVSDYLQASGDYIYAHSLSGNPTEEYFDISQEESEEIIAKIIDNSIPYAEAQSGFSDTVFSDSKGYSIEILNASGITGLAAFYQEELEKAGYTVVHIGNYTLGTLTESRIAVREAGLGQDLPAYVGTATVEVLELPDGIDIQILLGTMAEQ